MRDTVLDVIVWSHVIGFMLLAVVIVVGGAWGIYYAIREWRERERRMRDVLDE